MSLSCQFTTQTNQLTWNETPQESPYLILTSLFLKEGKELVASRFRSVTSLKINEEKNRRVTMSSPQTLSEDLPSSPPCPSVRHPRTRDTALAYPSVIKNRGRKRNEDIPKLLSQLFHQSLFRPFRYRADEREDDA